MHIAFILKGYPRLSETFIAQEIQAMEARGHHITIVSLRHPSDELTHPIHCHIKAPIIYLPEYLHHEPLRCLKSLLGCLFYKKILKCLWYWILDIVRDPTLNRIRRLGQAITLAHELDPHITQLHFHFAHTPASVARYTSMLTGIPFSGSAHAKDIWTTPSWDLIAKLKASLFVCVCTQAGEQALRALLSETEALRVRLIYHGVHLDKIAVATTDTPAQSLPNQPFEILSVARLVPKKGYEDLLAALAQLKGFDWHFTHIGPGNPQALQALAKKLNIDHHITWKGAMKHFDILASMRQSDVFVLASKIDPSGDRDGLPNVLMEAASQKLALIASDVSAIPELIDDHATGLLVPPSNPILLAQAISKLATQPDTRFQIAHGGYAALFAKFDANIWLDRLDQMFRIKL